MITHSPQSFLYRGYVKIHFANTLNLYNKKQKNPKIHKSLANKQISIRNIGMVCHIVLYAIFSIKASWVSFQNSFPKYCRTPTIEFVFISTYKTRLPRG